MKTNSHIKFANILNFVQLYLESIDLSKIYVDLKFQKARSNRRLLAQWQSSDGKLQCRWFLD